VIDVNFDRRAFLTQRIRYQVAANLIIEEKRKRPKSLSVLFR